MEKVKRIVAVLVVLSLSAGAYYAYEKHYKNDTSLIQATGTIEATSVDLSARIPGVIRNFTAGEGDTVNRDQVVAEISRPDLAAQRERDALGVLKASAQLDDLLSGARVHEKNEAEANVDTARLTFEKAARDFEKMDSLYSEGAATQSDWDKARVARDIAENQLKAAESRLKALEAGTRPDVIAAAKAEVERSGAMLKATEAMLEDLKIISPITGVILVKNFEEGEYAQAGAPVATAANLDALWIKVYISTDDLPHIRLGQDVSFSVSGYDQVFNGKVAEIAQKGEFTPKTIQTKNERTNVVFGVKISIDSAGGILKPGMPADVDFGRRDRDE